MTVVAYGVDHGVDGLLNVVRCYVNPRTALVLMRGSAPMGHLLLSQGVLKDHNISYDRFQTLWSIFPDSFVVWKSLTVQERPTVFIGLLAKFYGV